MDCCLFYGRPSFSFATLPFGTYGRPIDFGLRIDRRPLIVLASASVSSASKCEFGGLNAPLEPRTPAGRFLSGVLLDDRGSFQFVAREQLEMLAAERDEADASMRLSLGSDEACLHSWLNSLRMAWAGEGVLVRRVPVTAGGRCSCTAAGHCVASSRGLRD